MALQAQIPTQFSYQGVLTSTSGTLVPDGTYSLSFALYESSTGGTALWSETQDIVVLGGILEAIVGSAVPIALPFDRQLYLGIAVDGGQELRPRTALVPVPYSIRARTVELVTSGSIGPGAAVKSVQGLRDDIILSAGANIGITTTGNTIAISASGSRWTASGSAVYTSANVGVGTATPLAPLHIAGGIAATGTTGVVSATGAGVRLLWHASMRALRAGEVTGSHWDEAQTGLYSIAFGYNNTGRGNWSSIPGGRNLTLGDNSFGFNTSALPVDISTTSATAYFGDVDLWLGNVDGTARTLRFYEPSSDVLSAHYTAFGARQQSASIVYSWPGEPPTAPGQVLGVATTASVATGATVELAWLTPLAGNGGGPGGGGGAGGGGGIAWFITGNSGTVAPGHFLGTTDGQPLHLRAGNATTAVFQLNGAFQRTHRGDARGIDAVDFQRSGTAATQVASGQLSFIGNGAGNTAAGTMSFIGNGWSNTAGATQASIVGGSFHTVLAPYAFIGGGVSNAVHGAYGFAGGGSFNSAATTGSAIVGGNWNSAEGEMSFVGAGTTNKTRAALAVVVGGRQNEAAGEYSFVGGGNFNTASTTGSVVAGGNHNRASGEMAFVGGGVLNRAATSGSVVAGGQSNESHGEMSFVGSGYANAAIGHGSAIAGGRENLNRGFCSFIGAGGGCSDGGFGNLISGDNGGIVAGCRNRIHASSAFIGAGVYNLIDTIAPLSAVLNGERDSIMQGTYCTIAGGVRNYLLVQDTPLDPDRGSSMIGAGRENRMFGGYSFIGAGRRNGIADTVNNAFIGTGYENCVAGTGGAVAGGFQDTVSGLYAFIGAGELNRAAGDVSFIGAGYGNTASGTHSFVGGGNENSALDSNDVVVGGQFNIARGGTAFVGAGSRNSNAGMHAFLGAGVRNTVGGEGGFLGAGDSNAVAVQAANSAVVGGFANAVLDSNSFAGAGERNVVDGVGSFIGAGLRNTTLADAAFVGAGRGNTASGERAAVVAGDSNRAEGVNAVVAGGLFCLADGTGALAHGYKDTAHGAYSIALGNLAHARHDNSIVISAATDGNFMNSSTSGQIVLRATRGLYITRNAATPPVATTAVIGTSVGAYLSGGGMWMNASDRALKENFRSVDRRDLLRKISALEILRWNYRSEAPSVQHIGPMAQDFYRLFGVGGDDRSISTVDPSGIALAGIQALAEVNEQLQVEKRELAGQVESLERRVADLVKRLEALEKK